MKTLKEFKDLLDKIDALLESYDPGELEGDKLVREIFVERASQRPIFEEAISLATEGLESFPFNPELLRRRSYAYSRVVTEEAEFPYLDEAEEDLRAILEFNPGDLTTLLDLLSDMFTYSAMEDEEIAKLAGSLAKDAERVLLCFRALQIEAFDNAEKHLEALAVLETWSKIFPKSRELKAAKANLSPRQED